MTKVKKIGAVLHKKSAVSGKTPTAAQLEYGEIAVNYNADTPFVSFKNSEDSIVKIVPADNVTALTVDNANQQIILDKVNANGTVTQLSGDATNIIFEGDVKDGLEVDNHLVKVKLKTGEKVLTVDTGGVESHISLSAETSVANGAATLSTILSGNTQQLNNIEHKISSGNGIAVSGGTTGVTVSAKIDATSASGLTVSANGIKLSGDTAINSASTNVVQNKVVYEQLDGLKFKHLTHAQYDALATKDPNTCYIITDN